VVLTNRLLKEGKKVILPRELEAAFEETVKVARNKFLQSKGGRGRVG